MPDITINNETQYTLTATILDQIKRDALEYFGESLRSITVQYDIERHAFNAKTGALRYAFSPRDFGLVDTRVSSADVYHIRDVPRIDDDAEDEVDDTDFDEDDLEEMEAETTSLESLEEDFDDTEEEDVGFHTLGDAFDEDEDEDRDVLFDDEDD